MRSLSNLRNLRGLGRASNGPPAGLVTAGLVAYYDFVQGADAQVLYDKSGNDRHGQLGATTGADTNDPTWNARGLAGDGGDRLTLPTSAFTSETLTIITALRAPATSAGSLHLWGIAFGTKRARAYRNNASGQLNVETFDGAASSFSAVGALPITLGADMVLLVSVNRATGGVSGAKDGGAISTVTGKVTTGDPTAAYALADHAASTSTGWTGEEHALLVYDRALTQSEWERVYRFLKRAKGGLYP